MASGGVRGAEVILETRLGQDQLQGDLRESGNRIKALTSKLEAATKQFRIQEETIRNTKAQLKAMSGEMERQNALAKERAKVESQLATATRKMEAQKMTIAQLTGAISDANVQLGKLSGADFTKQEQRIATLEKRVTSARSAFEKSTTTVSMLRRELDLIEMPDTVFKTKFDSLTEGLTETTAAMSETAEEAKILMRELDKLDTAGGLERASKSANNFLIILGNIGKVGGGVFAGIQRAASMLLRVFRALGSAAATVARVMATAFSSVGRLSIVAARGFGRVFALFRGLVPQVNLFNRSITRSNSRIAIFTRRLSRLAVGWTVFMLLRRAINQVMQDMGVLIGYSESLTRSLNDIRVNLWIAAAPIWEALVPIFERIAAAVVVATRALAVFVTLLTGSTWQAANAAGEALYNQARGYDDLASSAANARRNLQGFDELNVLQEDTGAGDVGGGLDFDVEPPSEGMIEAIQRLIDILHEFWEQVRAFGTPDFDPEYWFNLGYNLAQRLADGLSQVNWEHINAIFGDALQALANIINGIFANDDLWYQVERFIREGLGGALDEITRFLNTLEGMNIGRRLAGVFDAFVDIIPNAAAALHAGAHLLFDIFDGFLDEAFYRDTFRKLGYNLGEAVTLLSDLIPRIGYTGANVVNAFFQVLEGFNDGARWGEIGTNISQGITNLITGINWEENAEILADFINGLVYTIYTVLYDTDWGYLGYRMMSGLMTLIRGIEWDTLGYTFAELFNSIFDFLRGVIEEFDPMEVATAIGLLVNSFFANVDWSNAGQTTSDIALGILNTLLEAIRAVNWQQVGASIGEFLAAIDWRGVLSATFEIIKELLIGFHAMLSEIFGEGLATAIMVIVPLLYGLGAVLPPIIKGFLALKTAAGMAGAGGSIKALIAPFAAVIAKAAAVVAAIGAVVGIFVYLWTTNDKFRENVTNSWESIKQSASDIFSGIITIITTIWETISPIVIPIIEFLKERVVQIFENIVSGIEIKLNLLAGIINTIVAIINGDWGAAWEGIKQVVESIFNGIVLFFESLVQPFVEIGGNLIGGLLGGIVEVIKNIFSWLRENVFMPIWNGIRSLFGINSPSTVMMEIGRDIILGLLGGISDNVRAVIERVTTFASELTDGLRNAVSTAREIGTNMMSGLRDGINNAANSVVEAAQGVGRRALNGVQNLLGISSPSTVFRDDVGYEIGRGLSVGIASAYDLIENALHDVLFGAKDEAEGAADAFSGHGNEISNRLADGISSGADLVKSAVKDAIGGAEDALSKFSQAADKTTVDMKANLLVTAEGLSTSKKSIYETMTDALKTMVQEFARATQDMFSDLASEIETIKDAMARMLKDLFERLARETGRTIEQMARDIENKYRTMQTSVQSSMQSFYSGMLSNLQSFVSSYLSQMQNMVQQVMQMIQQMQAAKASLSSAGGSSRVNIPRLAQGAVIPGGSPFMAVLGDQPRGQTNIEAPLSTIEQAVSRTIAPLLASPLTANVTAALAAQGARMGRSGGSRDISDRQLEKIAKKISAQNEQSTGQIVSVLYQVIEQLAKGHVIEADGIAFARTVARNNVSYTRLVGADMLS